MTNEQYGNTGAMQIAKYDDELRVAQERRDPPVGGWRTMDSAPKDGTWVLIWNGDNLVTPETPAIAKHYSGKKWKTVDAGCCFPTAWMPLPPAPGDQPDPVQEAARVREFLSEFANYKFEEIRNFSGPSPEDELESMTEHSPIAAFQEDAQALLETAFPKRCMGGDMDAFNGECLWCGAPMGGTCQDRTLADKGEG